MAPYRHFNKITLLSLLLTALSLIQYVHADNAKSDSFLGLPVPVVNFQTTEHATHQSTTVTKSARTEQVSTISNTTLLMDLQTTQSLDVTHTPASTNKEATSSLLSVTVESHSTLNHGDEQIDAKLDKSPLETTHMPNTEKVTPKSTELTSKTNEIKNVESTMQYFPNTSPSFKNGSTPGVNGSKVVDSTEERKTNTASTVGLIVLSTMAPTMVSKSQEVSTSHVIVSSTDVVTTTGSAALREQSSLQTTPKSHNSTSLTGAPTASKIVNTDKGEKGDTFWPVATALTIAIPAVVVFSVTITVLYRRRKAKPRSSMSMYGHGYSNM